MTQSPASVVDSGHSLSINLENKDILIENNELVATLQNDGSNECNDKNESKVTDRQFSPINKSGLISPAEGASFFNSGVEARASTLRERRRRCTLNGQGGSQSKATETKTLNQLNSSKTDSGPKNWSSSLLEHKVKLRTTGDEGEVCAVIDKGWIQVRLASGRKVKTRPGLVEALEIPSDEAAATIATFASKTKSLSGNSGASAPEAYDAPPRRSAAAATRKRRSVSNEESAYTERRSQGIDKRRRRSQRSYCDEARGEGSFEGADVYVEEKFNECRNQDQFYPSRDESEDGSYGEMVDHSSLEHDSESEDENADGRALVTESYKLMQVCVRFPKHRAFTSNILCPPAYMMLLRLPTKFLFCILLYRPCSKFMHSRPRSAPRKNT